MRVDQYECSFASPNGDPDNRPRTTVPWGSLSFRFPQAESGRRGAVSDNVRRRLEPPCDPWLQKSHCRLFDPVPHVSDRVPLRGRRVAPAERCLPRVCSLTDPARLSNSAVNFLNSSSRAARKAEIISLSVAPASEWARNTEVSPPDDSISCFSH